MLINTGILYADIRISVYKKQRIKGGINTLGKHADPIQAVDKNFQLVLFRLFTPIALTFVGTYAVLQFRNSQAAIAWLYVAAFLIIACNWYALRWHNSTKLAANIFVAQGPIVLLPWQITGGINSSGLLWFSAYVVFVMYFVREFWGTFWVVLTYGISGILLLLQINGDLNMPFARDIMWHFYFVGAITYAIALLFWRAQKEVYDKLRTTSLSLHESQRVAKLGGWEWNIAADVVTWSDNLYQLFGVDPRKKLNYGTYLQHVYPPDRKMVDNVIKTTFSETSSFTMQHRVKKPDGSVIWIQGQGKVEVDAEGKPIRMYGTAQDVTEIKDAEVKIEKHAEEVEKLNALMVGRELKMLELKREINEMRKQLQKETNAR